MPVGAPLVTPGAGTAQGVRDIARGVPAVLPVNRDIAAGHPGGRTGCLRHCGGRCATMPVGAPLVTPGAGTAQGVRDIARGVPAVLPVNRDIAAGHPGGRTGCLRRCGSHPGDTSVAPTLRGARPRYCGKPWLSTVDDFDDRDGLDKLTFRYVTVRSYLDGAFSIRYVDVLTVIIRGRFIGQQKYNCPDRRHDHS